MPLALGLGMVYSVFMCACVHIHKCVHACTGLMTNLLHQQRQSTRFNDYVHKERLHFKIQE